MNRLHVIVVLMQVVMLTFSAFQTESCCDFIRLYDGYDSSAGFIVELSGSPLLTSYYSSQMYMFVNFWTDGSITYSGFIATYQSSNGEQNITASPVHFNDDL